MTLAIRATFTLLLMMPMADRAAAPDANAETEATVTVTTAPAVVEQVEREITSYGIVEPDPDAADVVALQHAGVIRRVLVRQGERVRTGQMLVELDTAPGPKLQWEQALAAARYAEEQLARLQRMAANRLATDEQVAQAQRDLSDARATEQSLRSVGADTKQQVLRATRDAIVTQVLINAGDRMAADAPALNLAPVAGLIVRFGVESEAARRVTEGAAVKLGPVFDATRSFTGTAKRVHAMLNPTTRLVDVIVAIGETDAAALTIGDQMRGTIALDKIDAIVIPRSALLRDESGDYVFTVVSDRAHRVDVEILVDRASEVAIRGELTAGEPVVASGAYQLTDGTQVALDRAAR